MNIFNKRPLLLALFIFTICSVICTAFSPIARVLGTWLLFAAFIVCFIITIVMAVFKSKHLKVFTSVSLCLIFAFIAFFSSHSFFDKKLAYAESLSEEKNVVAEIRECTFSAPFATYYSANIKSIGGKDTSFMASISSYDNQFEVGQTILADMTFSNFKETTYGFDERASNISNGVLTSASIENAQVLEHDSKFDIIVFFNKLRANIADSIDKSGFDETAPLIKALIIGDRSDIDALTNYNFSRLGISHILSISGAHFTILLGMVAVLLSLFGFNKRIVYCILIPLALFYMGLSGFSFSVCRAGVMALLSYWGFLCGRQRDSYSALFIALAAILIVAPYAVFSISLWLSFTATLTILIIIELISPILFRKDIPWYKKLLNYVLSHLLITVSISFTTLPIIVIYFGTLSLASPLANLLIIPLFEIFLYIIPFAIILSSFPILVIITERYGSILLYIIKEFASIDNILIAVNQRFVLIIASIGIIATIILIAIPLKKKFIIVLPLLISIISIAIGLVMFYESRVNKTSVTYFNTSISDSLVITDTNKTMCIDITNGSSDSMYHTQAMVREHYSTKISAYVFTHLRSNHISSFKKLASRIKVEKIYLPDANDIKSAEYLSSIVSIAEDFDIKVNYYNYGEPFDFEECAVTVFAPEFINRTSHEIISVFVSTHKDDFLYLGSSFSETKTDYSPYAADAEYVIFGQHYPKIKKRFMLETDATLIYGNEEVYNLSDIPAAAAVLGDGGRYNFFLK